MPYLSKSKIIAYLQCPKRLWLEMNKPDERDDSGSEAAFAIGNEVGDAACSVFDPDGNGVNVDPNKIGWDEARSKVERLLKAGNHPIFEALLESGQAFALADLMLPDTRGDELQWQMLEVKSSTSAKEYHRDDVAIQTHIARENGVKLSQVGLAFINRDFVYPGAGNFKGLFQVEDLTNEAVHRDREVKQWIANAQEVAHQTQEPLVEMGDHCHKPFDCVFSSYCKRLNGLEADPLKLLPGIRDERIKAWKSRGIHTLDNVPDEEINFRQRMVKNCSLQNKVYFDKAKARQRVACADTVLYFLDFETINMAVPRWVGTRPYQQIPFQYSLHIRLPDGELHHDDFLDISGEDPREALAQKLVQDCDTAGVIYAYNMGFEKRIVRELAEEFPTLSESLMKLHERIDDLLPIVRECYYNPSQNGSWSLKAVLPALCPELDYSSLEDVQHGGHAMDAYREAIHPETSPVRKKHLYERMLAYCELDTLATVRIWEYFSNLPPPNSVFVRNQKGVVKVRR